MSNLLNKFSKPVKFRIRKIEVCHVYKQKEPRSFARAHMMTMLSNDNATWPISD